MRTRHVRRFLTGAAATMAACAITAASLGAVGASAAGAATTNQGVTPTAIKIGMLAAQTAAYGAPIFKPFITGMQAYLKMVNSQGGVNGRKITLAWNYTTGLTPTKFTTLARQVVQQDHAFAVGVSTFSFTPAFLKQAGIPTYGWNTSGNWTGAPNLYAAGGSVQFYTALVPEVAYLAKKAKRTTAAVLGINAASSGPACSAAAKKLPKLGVKVAFENLNVGKTLASTVQRMRSKGINFVLSCMYKTTNVTLSRYMQEYGVKATQYWLTGGTTQLYGKYPTLTTGAYVRTTSVPFTLPSNVAKYYPGLNKYRTWMKKYAPSVLTSQVALSGWASGALLVAGLKVAGKNPTQQGLVKATNKINNFTATGMMTLTKWTSAHTKATGPYCTAFVQVHKTKLVAKYLNGHQVFTCFKLNSTTPVKAPPGTPGAT